MSDTSKFLTMQQLADELQVPVKTIYDWRYRRIGPPSVKVGRSIRFRRTDVERWLTEHKEAS